MNNDPYSWGDINQMDRMIRKEKEEFKREELRKEEQC